MNFSNMTMKGGQGVFETIKWRVRNRGGATAVAIGDLMCFDLTASQSETSSGEGPGGLTGLPVNDAVWLNIIDPTVPATILSNCYCVVVDLLDGAGADNTEVEVLVQGAVSVEVNGTNFTRNQALMPAATASLRQLILYADAAGNRPIANITTPVDTSGAAAVSPVQFYGWAGMVGGNQT